MKGRIATSIEQGNRRAPGLRLLSKDETQRLEIQKPAGADPVRAFLWGWLVGAVMVAAGLGWVIWRLKAR